MEVIEYIKATMKEQGITQMELARRTGISRQSVFDMLSRENPNYNTVKRVFSVLGKDLEFRRKDGKPLDFDINSFEEVLKREAPGYGRLKAILDVMGYEIIYTDKQ